MSLSKSQPLSELRGMRKKMDSVFEELLFIGRNDSSSIQNRGLMWTPTVEIKEINNKLILKAKIPGIDINDLEVEVVENRVTISGKYQKEEVNKDENRGYFYSESNYGRFQRIIPLPVSIKTEGVEYDLKNGILTINLSKLGKARQKVVKVNFETNQKFSRI